MQLLGRIEIPIEDSKIGSAINGVDKSKKLSLNTARLLLMILKAKGSRGRNPDFTIRYYLQTTLLALMHSKWGPNDFHLCIDEENQDLKRIIAESIGTAFGIRLMVRDMGARIDRIRQITPSDVKVGSKTNDRPDFIFETDNGFCLLECKGTTRREYLNTQQERAIDQVKITEIEGYPVIKGRYFTCTYIPVENDLAGPLIIAGDPEPGMDRIPVFLDEGVLRNSQLFHYADMANIVGLRSLSEFLRRTADFPKSENLDRYKKEAEAEFHETMGIDDSNFRLGNRELVGRKIRVPQMSHLSPIDGGCPFLSIQLGLDKTIIAMLLMGPQEETIDDEINKITEIDESFTILNSDGSGIIINENDPDNKIETDNEKERGHWIEFN